jgi:hypothetical protein
MSMPSWFNVLQVCTLVVTVRLNIPQFNALFQPAFSEHTSHRHCLPKLINLTWPHCVHIYSPTQQIKDVLTKALSLHIRHYSDHSISGPLTIKLGYSQNSKYRKLAFKHIIIKLTLTGFNTKFAINDSVKKRARKPKGLHHGITTYI